MATQDFDAIVVGSGMSGGWAARELTGKGLKTLMIERGRSVEHRVDYPTEGRTDFNMAYRGRMRRGAAERDYTGNPFAGAYDHFFFANYRQNPYILDPEKPFNWVRSDIVGGKTVVWGRQCYRWSELDFEANKSDGHGIDWPIRYGDLAPWYSYVERYAGISGERLGLPQLPDSEFQPPMDLNVAEKHFKRAVAERFGGRVVTIGRTANLTESKPEQGRVKCQYRNQCTRGCSFGAPFSALATTLPDAQATGNLTLLHDTVVASLEYDAETERVTGVRVIDKKSGARTTYRSRIVFLNASCIATTQILLNSRSAAMPNGLGNNHDIVGRYLVDHPWGAGATGTLPGLTEFVEFGRRPTSMYIPRFRNINGMEPDCDFLRGYNFQSWGGGRSEPVDHSGFGADLKARLRMPGPWKLPLYSFCEVLPRRDSRMMVDENKPDLYGIPQVKFDIVWHDNELRMIEDSVDQAVRMLEAAGCTDIETRPDPLPPGTGIHEMGTARMGADPRESVVNAWNQMHVANNVFITDGAAMSSGSCVNPSLTFMAFTARAANHAVELLSSNQL